MSPPADVLVIGGGLHGCSAALHLARRGARVTVLEKDHVGRHASGVNAGGVRLLGRHFAEVPLSLAAMEMWHRIGGLVGEDCGFGIRGQVKVAETEAELETLSHRVAALRAQGFTHEEMLDRAALRTVLPAIADHCVGGVISRADGAADPYRTVTAFHRQAKRLGVRFAEGAQAIALRRQGSAWEVTTADGMRRVAPVLVNCAGAWAARIAAALGESVPLESHAMMVMATDRMPAFVHPVVNAAARPISFKQLANGTVLIGGGHRGRTHRDGNRTELDLAALARSAATARALFPAMRSASVLRAWAGTEGFLPDGIPVIGASADVPGAFHAFGFCGHGFQLGPVVGAIIAELVATGRTNLPIAPFSIARFRQAPGSAIRAAAPGRSEKWPAHPP